MTSEPVKCPCCGQATTPVDAVTVGLQENRLVYRGQSIPLWPRLAELAFVLARRMPETVSYDTIISAMWGEAEGTDASNSVKVAVHELRPKLAPLGLRIVNTKDRGYRLDVVTEMVRSERILDVRSGAWRGHSVRGVAFDTRYERETHA